MPRRLPLFSCLLVVALLALSGGVALATQSAPEIVPNWAGWVDLANAHPSGRAAHFTSISASWVQPTITCTPLHQPSDVAFWIGLGGSNGAHSLEQIGTEVNCRNPVYGPLLYWAFYQLYPLPGGLMNVPIKPHDSITASVTVAGKAVTMKLRDNTTGVASVKHLTMSSPTPDTNTAEWIVEAPSDKPLGLANFGKMSFTGASATSVGPAGTHTGPIRDSTWEHYWPDTLSGNFYSAGFGNIVDGKNFTMPGPLNAAGNGFPVTFGSSIPNVIGVHIGTQPPASSSNTTADFTYVLDGNLTDATTWSCTLDGKSTPCSKYAAHVSNLSVGTHTFVVVINGPKGVGTASDTFVVTAP